MIEQDLIPMMHDLARAAGLGVGRDCESEVRAFIRAADDTYQAGTAEVRSKIRAAFMTFVGEMVTEAKQLGLTELRERTYHAARVRLCPLWPFC